jgi:FkbM family methyltransferase
VSLRQPDLEFYLGRPIALEPYLKFLLKSNKAPVIFDIGACEGEDSIRYSRLFPRARVLAVEALPANQEILRANFAKYGVSAELIPVALSDKRGTSVFHVSAGRPKDLFSGESWNYGNKSSSLLPPAAAEPMYGWISFPEQITVQCETLVDVCAARNLDHIDFIHMDVQGAEGLVLEGARPMLPRIRLIWLEVSNQLLYQGQKLRSEIEAMLVSESFTMAYEESRGAEGDQLYVNRRFLRNRLWLAARRAQRFCSSMARRFRPTPASQ